MKIKVDKLNILPYADESCGEPRFITFTFGEVRDAIAEKRLDTRSFQGDFDDLTKEWGDGASYDVYLERSKKYHIERIAYLAVSQLWKEPIKVRPDLKAIIDGQHRAWAAKYLKEDEIEAIIE